MKTARRPITAETFRPERVDADGRPEIITGDAATDPTPAAPTSSPAPAQPPTVATGPEPAPAPVTAAAGNGADPTAAPEPVAAGITTSEILAALGARPPTVHVTREPSPYLEGGRIVQTRGFFADLYAAGARGDGEAGRRAAQFQAQLRDYIAAARRRRLPMPTSSRRRGAARGTWNRSQQLRPCTGAFSSASITDPRPIPVPKFKDTTPSALVGDHVEGQPDAPGQVNFEQVTVTPKAKSGRAEISRELLDSSPALVDRVVSSALRESYSQITESTMAGVLAAGATAGPAGGADAVAAEKAIRVALGMLPGTRFAPGRVILPSSHVWGALVGADGTDGRPLFPYLLNGPTNAAGTTSTAYSSGSIAGVETRPAWALGERRDHHRRRPVGCDEF